MKAFCFSLTVFFCVVQSVLAIPRPDFAINGAIAGHEKTVTAAQALGAEFAKIGGTAGVYDSGYELLTTIDGLLEQVADSLMSAGSSLANTLSALAADDNGPISTSFSTVETAISGLETILSTTLDPVLQQLTDAVGQDIQEQFEDSFVTVAGTLGDLKTALGNIKAEVTKAKTAAGLSSSVSAAIIRRNVQSKTVTAVTNEVRALRANIPLITFIIQSTRDNLALADEFIIDIEAEATGATASYDAAVTAFQEALAAEATTINEKIEAKITATVVEILDPISADLSATTEFTAGLSTQLDSVNTLLTSGVSALSTEITGYFDDYSESAGLLLSDLDEKIGGILCDPLKQVLLTLVGNGPYADFCFSKYSPRVFSLVTLTTGALEACFEQEVARLTRLEAIVENIIVQILFNVEDLFDNLSVCLAIEQPGRGQCFTAITPYYTQLAVKAADHVDTLTGLIDAETIASLQRLGACLSTSLYVTVAGATDISSEVVTCTIDGPAPLDP